MLHRHYNQGPCVKRGSYTSCLVSDASQQSNGELSNSPQPLDHLDGMDGRDGGVGYQWV